MLTCNRWLNTQYEKLKKLQKKFDSQYKIYIIPHKQARVVSSVGRASALHAECRRFDPVTTHQFLAHDFFWLNQSDLSSGSSVG